MICIGASRRHECFMVSTLLACFAPPRRQLLSGAMCGRRDSNKVSSLDPLDAIDVEFS